MIKALYTTTYFLLLSVRVMPCEDTLKCTAVVLRLEALFIVVSIARAIAGEPTKKNGM